ncbi:adenylate cyclase type 9-like isoform X2 [Dreissena polymorpha]|uniref:adenylate cyclase type 9-like isoform X2 n=1 Tax=Dreissena polymorpha TaxID=45954 RepID=UPI00226554A6|nr:adenylate cyclase type 9-like isoform X2 [Dreissena polymorpha]
MTKENNGKSSVEQIGYTRNENHETVRFSSVSSGSPNHLQHQSGCLNLPQLFERTGSWWPSPRFDSDILEKAQWNTYFPQTRRRFQYALFYMLAACLVWTLYFGLTKAHSYHWPNFLIGTLVLLCLICVVLGFTYTRYYQKFYLLTSIVVSILICSGILATVQAFRASDLSTVGSFTATVEVLLMMYSVIPMPLAATLVIGVIYSVVFEVLTAVQNHYMQAPVFIAGKILLHLCIHLMGIHIFIMRQVRQRSTFWKIGQSAISRQDLKIEREIREKMIHSLMPPSVAAEVMRSRADGGEKEDELTEMQPRKRGSKGKVTPKGQMIFRTFNMNKMVDVSILFADIVGFTKMSSNKTAEVLVGQLNDLFGRFDDLCQKSGCEKISTLGDCYYCVSGCPEPKPDHARCCVEMGLGMIEAIQKFDEENNESVNMRVGVHTGTVLCGIVGTRRFKFDVWSNDVTLANEMESTGQPGRVHISEHTLEFLGDEYEVEPGEEVEDNRSDKKIVEAYDKTTSTYTVKHATWDKKIKTYFIVGRKKKDVPKSETVVVAIDGDVATQSSEHDNLMNDAGKEVGDVNGVSTTAMLVKSHLNNSLNELNHADSMQDLDREPIDKTWTKFRNINYHSDKQLVRLVEGVKEREMFFKPPINRCMLTFEEDELEENYRDHYMEDQHNQQTISAPKYHSFLEIFVSFFVFAIISAFCFLVFDRQLPWIVFFCISFVLEILNIVRSVLTIKYAENREGSKWIKMINITSAWYFRNILGVVSASIPMAGVFSNFSCQLMDNTQWCDRFFCFCIVVSLLHYTNFTTLSSWMKSIFALLAGATLIVLIAVIKCSPDVADNLDNVTTVSPSVMTTLVYVNSTFINKTELTLLVLPDQDKNYVPLFAGFSILHIEIILDMILLIVLITFLNYESETSYRHNYYGDSQAWKYKQIMQEHKDQADWLLHNILPPHVSEIVRQTSKYSKNHKDVGVIFAAIVNFNDIYDESYEGGREFLRVLNELVSDYEDLLDRPEFKDVEKIKTISSTFMAASGLNEISRAQNQHPHAHLYALMMFCVELHDAIRRFNDSIFNFDFILNIGYNYGEVTAGVIGTTKLLYDIWGDTVNISSRMYSTGVAGRTQVPESTANKLGDKMDFEYRDEISVKGKGMMKTYLFKGVKPGAHWE